MSNEESAPSITKAFCNTTTADFIVPPEAPIFYPTKEEFLEPIQYINKIRPVAEETGICKIVPPQNWKPPFALDVDHFTFSARIQRLNMLDGKLREKINFLDHIFKFWDLQGFPIIIPEIDKKLIDLHELYKLAHDEGRSNSKEEWIRIAQIMGFSPNENVAAILKHCFDHILHPFDIFNEQKLCEIKCKEPNLKEENIKHESEENLLIPKQQDKDECTETYTDILLEPNVFRELKRLQFRGAGPKMNSSSSSKRPRHKVTYNLDGNEVNTCHKCEIDDDDEFSLLSCIGCKAKYHLACIIPPISGFPKSDWYCFKCIAREISKPEDDFGFEQAEREYTLFEFGEMADKFKTEYFKLPSHLVSAETVEQEYWRIVSSTDKEVTVQYGADLHAVDNGSGFPTNACTNLQPGDLEYVDCGWNLNNLPVLKNSVLSYINSNISGMKIPWMYVGMCFATFCWHNEDHWSYSINYLHWGETKTWYGIPGKDAEAFEKAMKSESPELFRAQPDLLHQLVTIMNPNILMNANIPVYKINQNEGEFVVTFPRAYHMGFNQGFNFAEAVNFSPADWIKMGRECVLHYADLRRFCVFSHDELLFTIASAADKLSPIIATATYSDIAVVVQREEKSWKDLFNNGLSSVEQEKFELLPDDKRHCEVCKTTCYLSAVTCSCSPTTLACLKHYVDVCKCPTLIKTLKYRYTLDELNAMVKNVKDVVDGYDGWLKKVQLALNHDKNTLPTLLHLQNLLNDAEKNNYPTDCTSRKTLLKVIEEVEPFATIILKLINYQQCFTTTAAYIMNLDELKQLKLEISKLPYSTEEFDFVNNLFEKCVNLEDSAKHLLRLPLNAVNKIELQSCIDNESKICVQLPSLKDLRARMLQVTWFSDATAICKNGNNISEINEILSKIELLPPHKMIESKSVELIRLVHYIENRERLPASSHLTKNSDVEMIEELDVMVPGAQEETNSYNKRAGIDEWKQNCKKLYNSGQFPYIKDVQDIFDQGANLQTNLPELGKLGENISSAFAWVENVSNVFIRKNSNVNLIHALCPRTPLALMAALKCRKLTLKDDPLLFIVSKDINFTELLKNYKDAQERELEGLQALRATNASKTFVGAQYRFCVCQRAFSGIMMQCELCKDWFHATCVELPKLAKVKLVENVIPLAIVLDPQDSRFLCHICRRTKRPRLKKINQFLKILANLQIRIPEGEILQCLAERCATWQHKVSTLLKIPQLSQNITEFRVISERLSRIIHAKTQTINYENSSIIETDQILLSSVRDGFKHLHISETTTKQIENVLIEADVMEVELEDSHLLWKLLLASKYYESSAVLRKF